MPPRCHSLFTWHHVLCSKARQSFALVLGASLTLSGCATSSKDIAASYISPIQYQNYDCEQLAQEAQRIHARSAQLAGRLDEAASNDQAIMGVGLVLFWPALFALGGTKEQEADFARLKGEYDAVQQTMIAKKCATVPSTAAAPASAASAAAPQNTASAPEAPALPSAPLPATNDATKR